MDAPARAQLAAVEHPEHDVAVAYVDAEQHGETASRSSGNKTLSMSRMHSTRAASDSRARGTSALAGSSCRCSGSGEAQILQLGPGRIDRRARQLQQRRTAPFPRQPRRAGRAQAAIQRRRAAPPGVGEQFVAGTQRQAVGGAHGRAADDGGRQAEIGP